MHCPVLFAPHVKIQDIWCLYHTFCNGSYEDTAEVSLNFKAFINMNNFITVYIIMLGHKPKGHIRNRLALIIHFPTKEECLGMILQYIQVWNAVTPSVQL